MSDDLRELYQDLILDHGKRPRNFRVPICVTHEALGHNPLCGDRLNLYLTLDKDQRTEMIKGKTLPEVEHLFDYLHHSCTGKPADATGLDEDDIARITALAGVRDYPIRVKCATLAWHTLHSALKNEAKVSTE